MWSNSFKYANLGTATGPTPITLNITTALPNSIKGERNAFVVTMPVQASTSELGGAFQTLLLNFESGEFGTTTALQNLEKIIDVKLYLNQEDRLLEILAS